MGLLQLWRSPFLCCTFASSQGWSGWWLAESMSALHPPWCVHPVLPPSGNKNKNISSFTVKMEAADYPITLIPIKPHSVISKKTIIFKIQAGITHAFIIHIFSYLLFYFCHKIHHYPTQSYSEAAMHGHWIVCAVSLTCPTILTVTSHPAPTPCSVSLHIFSVCGDFQ